MSKEITCEQCGQTKIKDRRNVGSGRFCSMECFRAFQAQQPAKNLEQAKHRISALEAQISNMRRRDSIMRQLIDAVVTTIHEIPEIELGPMVPREENEALDPEDVIVHVSDSQLGQTVDASTTGGLGAYNYETFCQRAENLRDGIAAILKYHPNPIEKCHIVMGGDMVEGSGIFRGQQRQLDLGLAQQVIFGYERFSRMIADIAAMGFAEVIVSCVPGNHGRIGRKDESAPNDNMDTLLYYFLQERFKNIQNVRFNIPQSWWMVLDVRGWKFLISHGDEFQGWAGIPFYGALRYQQRMRELLRQCFQKRGEQLPDFDAILCGHHHELAAFRGIFMNGCWPGGSEFSLHRLQVGGPPYQQMLGVHDRFLCSWHRAIQLEREVNLPEMPVYS